MYAPASTRKNQVVTTTTTTKKTTRNRKRRQNKNQRIKQSRSAPTVVTQSPIAKCTREYIGALANPFGLRSTLPCIPDSIVLPSYKFQTKCRGVFSTGLNGTGFVLLDPFAMAWNNGGLAPTTSNYPVLYSGPDYAQSSALQLTVEASEFIDDVYGANSNSLFSRANLAEGNRQLRLVAGGIRATYIGSNFKNQGRVVLYKSTSNISVPPTLAVPAMLNDNYTAICPVSRKTEYVFYTPDSHTYLGYANASSYDIQNGGLNHYNLLICVDGGDQTTPQSWLFEAVSYFEMIGQNITLSPSHSDVQGLGQALGALPVTNPTTTPAVTENTIMNRVYTSLQEQFGNMLVGAATVAPKMIANAAYQYFGSPQTPRLTQFAHVEEV